MWPTTSELIAAEKSHIYNWKTITNTRRVCMSELLVALYAQKFAKGNANLFNAVENV